jgi:hypothetical protein
MNLFKNKKGQRKKKHVQRGTGEKKTIFAADNQQSRRFEARLAPRRCSIQNPPQKYIMSGKTGKTRFGATIETTTDQPTDRPALLGRRKHGTEKLRTHKLGGKTGYGMKSSV